MDLCDRGGHKGIAHGQVLRQAVVSQHAGKVDPLGNVGLGSHLDQGFFFRSAADDKQVGIVNCLGHTCKGPQ